MHSVAGESITVAAKGCCALGQGVVPWAYFTCQEQSTGCKGMLYSVVACPYANPYHAGQQGKMMYIVAGEQL